MNEIITLQNIRFRYNGTPALNDVTLALEPGVYGLLGPNGAGKTTLLKVLLGFLSPEAGGGEVFGMRLPADKKEIRRYLGYMPESDCLIPGMDAVTLTAYLAELAGMPRREAFRRAHDVLYFVGLEESRYRLVETYSTGMKQRLKLAQALVHDPKMLLLDEPTNGMDPSGRQDMLDLVQDITAKGTMNILFSSHLLPDIEAVCRHVLIMNQGRIVAQQAIADLNREKRETYEIGFSGARTAMLAQLQARGWGGEENEKGLVRVTLPAEESTVALFRLARHCGAQIRHLTHSRTSLEDAFMRAIGEDHAH